MHSVQSTFRESVRSRRAPDSVKGKDRAQGPHVATEWLHVQIVIVQHTNIIKNTAWTLANSNQLSEHNSGA